MNECEECHAAIMALINNPNSFLRCQLCKTPTAAPTLTYAAVTSLFVDHAMPTALGRVHIKMIRPDVLFEPFDRDNDEAYIFGNYWCFYCRAVPNAETSKQFT